MTNVTLLPCPMCNAAPSQPRKEDCGDERNGYNFKIAIRCTCGLSLLTESRRGDGGWCDDTGQALERAIMLWNMREAPKKDATAVADVLRKLLQSIRYTPLGLGTLNLIREADSTLRDYDNVE